MLTKRELERYCVDLAQVFGKGLSMNLFGIPKPAC